MEENKTEINSYSVNQLQNDFIRLKKNPQKNASQIYKSNLMALKEINTKLQMELNQTKIELNSINKKYNTLKETLSLMIPVEEVEHVIQDVLQNIYKNSNESNLENVQNNILNSSHIYDNQSNEYRKTFNEIGNPYKKESLELKKEIKEKEQANDQNKQYKISKTIKYHEIFLQQYKEKFNKLKIKSEQNKKEFSSSQKENLTSIREEFESKNESSKYEK
jgi:hypothetical protein